ncbi:hypothetical protein D3C78_1402540 [compost metagenome]
MLDEDTDETLEGTEHCTVQHHRVLATVVLADILGTEANRQVEVELQGTALPDSPQAILQRELDLRTVEGTFARLQLPRQTGVVQRGLQRSLGAIPQVVGADALLRAGRQLELDILETEVGVDVQGQLDEGGGLVLHLPFGAEDVGIVLHEAAHAHDAMQRTGRLVAVAGAELGQAQRQLAVAL